MLMTANDVLRSFRVRSGLSLQLQNPDKSPNASRSALDRRQRHDNVVEAGH
jgi:hypothetical protein